MTEVTDYSLSEASAAPVAEDEGSSSPSDAMLNERVIAALRTVHDPEIPVNIYDLGLIYRIDIVGPGAVEIDMTLTAPACPVAGEMVGWVQTAVREVDGVVNAKVNLIFDPPWDQTRMSDEAKLELGFF
jgi:FeS assembly SUF system protein